MLRRPSPLSALFESELAALWGCRLAKLLSIVLFAGYAVAMIVVARAGNRGSLDGIATNAARWLAWITGTLVAFSSARNAARIENRTDLLALIRQRGLSLDDLRVARPYAVAARIARLVGIPALALGALALVLTVSTDALSSRLVFLMLLGVWTIAVAALLAALSDVALRLNPDRAGWMLVALVAVPHMARSVWPLTPSAPALVAWLLSGVEAVAKAVG